MKAKIEKSGCIGCGLCTDICPVVFSMSKNAYAKVNVDIIPTDELDAVNEAIESCPASVITVEEE
ncbi:MAG: 4Fe-4S ferredoxin iron-sulfur binding domain protein [Anaerocolumna sp.]|jgi:ferredoxin|nr:4Fe-4S ferredoxin iron-sulfur binding domain protein [Anaerocolumna sp.]